MKVLVLALLIAVHGADAMDSSVSIRNGDVYLTTREGKEVRITQDGNYTEAQLSPNQKLLALVRKPDGIDPELIVRLADPETQKEVFALRGKVAVEKYSLPIEGSPAWSATGEVLYFLLDFTGTSAYLARVDLLRHQVTPMCDAIRYIVVPSGRYQGKIAARRRKQTLVFPWDWYWLIDDKCTELGPIGSESDLREFLNRFGGESSNPQHPNK